MFDGNDNVALSMTAPGGKRIAHIASLQFQSGPIPEYGVNGLTNEILLAVLIERTQRLNGMFPCAENIQAIVHMEKALDYFNARTARRQAAGIEGKHEERAND